MEKDKGFRGFKIVNFLFPFFSLVKFPKLKRRYSHKVNLERFSGKEKEISLPTLTVHS